MANYPSHTSTGNCIFCEIAQWIRAPLWWWLFRENDDYMARLSPFPNTEWCTVLIPKKHYDSDVLHMPDAKLQDFIIVAKKVAKVLEDHFEDVGRVGLMMEGTGIDHAHIKLFPMHWTWHMKTGQRKQYHSNNTSYYAKYDGYLSSNDWPREDDHVIQGLASQLKK